MHWIGKYGNLGPSFSTGAGTLQSGTTQSTGVFAEGGSGAAASGAVLTDGTGMSLSKIAYGLGSGEAGGAITCFDTLICKD
ncbi:MAG: hypothetical protein KQH63_04360 [Desulfobulbaceae bacterium]|nr:hypothetical protein [Desulfobulbaceae bacterium]